MVLFITYHTGGIVIEAENFLSPVQSQKKALAMINAECEVDIWPTSEILPPTAERFAGA